MALTATLHTLRLALNDSDRGVYQTLELRIARHPSETLEYMFSRTLAYCLFWEPNIAFSRGLSTTDEPAVWVKELDGRLKLWLDVGRPSADRLHKASKAAEKVAVCTFQDPEAFRRPLLGATIHRAQELEIVALPAEVLTVLEELVERRMEWEVTIAGGQLYIATGGQTLSGEISRAPLFE